MKMINIPDIVKTTIEGFKNIIKWFPIIWKDRDWDDHFIWEILKTKLKHQADYISKQDRHTNAQYDAQKMRLCVRLIEKIQNEFYGMEYMDYHESDFKFIPCKDKEEYSELEIVEISENFNDYFDKYKNAVRKVMKNQSLQRFELTIKDYKKTLAMNIAHYNENRAQDLLFKLLNKHIRSWWD